MKRIVVFIGDHLVANLLMLVVIIMTLLPVLAHAQTTNSSGWNTYHNNRYAYTTCYPSSLRPLRESDNGDGRQFVSGGAKQIVWGELNNDGSSLRQHLGVFPDPNEKVTYQVIRQGWAVQSGTIGSTIFYRKTYQHGDMFVTMQITYPVAAQAMFNPMVKTLSSCFRLD